MVAATDVFIAIVSYVTFLLLLVSVVLAVRSFVASARPVAVLINDQATTMTGGQNLLRALIDRDVLLPAACGGRGACGQCQIVVHNAHSGPLPTETNHLTRRQLNRGIRLACANRVRKNLSIAIPERYLSVHRHRCEVVSARQVSTFLREIVFSLPAGLSLAYESGQYVLIDAPAYDLRFADLNVDIPYVDAWRDAGLMALTSTSVAQQSRAYSIASPPGDSSQFAIVVRIALPPAHSPKDVPPGVVSSFLFSLNPGDAVTLAGPFGDFRVRDDTCEMVCIAGGAGIAPMRAIIRDELTRKQSQRKISFWYGARALRDVCYADEFEALAQHHDNFEWHVVLSDPAPTDQWDGTRGFIHTAVAERYLNAHAAPEEVDYYLCGPPVMSAAVMHMLEDLGVDRSSIFLDDFGTT